MKLAIDCREIRKGVTTGLSRVLTSFIKATDKKKIDSLLIVDRNVDVERLRNIKPDSKLIFIPYSNYFLDQIILPFYIRSSDVFFSIYPKFPLLFRGKIYITVADLIGYSKVKRCFVSNASKRVECIFTLSDYWKKEIGKITKSKVLRVTPDISYLPKLKRKKEKDGILYVGNFNPHKNLKNLLIGYKLATEEVNYEIPKLILCGGGGRYSEDIGPLIRELGLDSYISLRIKPPDSEVFKLYSSCLFFIFPSTDEGFGLPPLEASFYGAAVAVSDIPVFRESFSDKALFFDPYDPEDIKRKIIDMTHKVELREMISRGCREIALSFASKNVGEEILSFILS